MASIHKTFQVGEVLASADVNDGLNPATADHIPWAMDAGVANLALTPGAALAQLAISFAGSRFTKIPVVTVTLSGAAGGTQTLVARQWATSTTGCIIGVYNPAGNLPAGIPSTVSINWTAVQMAA